MNTLDYFFIQNTLPEQSFDTNMGTYSTSILGTTIMPLNSLTSLDVTSSVTPLIGTMPSMGYMPLATASNLNSYSNVTSYNPIIGNVNTYLWQGINNIIPTTLLYEKINYFENKYGMRSEEFYAKWLDGKFRSNLETNEWLNIYLLLKK